AAHVRSAAALRDEPRDVERRHRRHTVRAERALGVERAATLAALLGVRLDAPPHVNGEGLERARAEGLRNFIAVHRFSPETAATRGCRSASRSLPRRTRARCRRALSGPRGTPVISTISARP